MGGADRANHALARGLKKRSARLISRVFHFAFLASSEASYIIGAAIPSTAGRLPGSCDGGARQ